MTVSAQPSMYRKYGKRLVDVLSSAIGMLVLCPIFLIIAISVLVRDGRPVFFKQPRVGIDRTIFQIIKFRTMDQGESGTGNFDAGNKGRVTRNGALLRRTKLDELPQLFNVFRGDMSLVGPRPEVEPWTLTYKDRWDTVLTVRPGITDWAAIEFRTEEEILAEAENAEHTYKNDILPRKLDFAEKYVDRISPKEDLKIVLSTVRSLFR